MMQIAVEQLCVIQSDSQRSSTLQAGSSVRQNRPVHALHLMQRQWTSIRRGLTSSNAAMPFILGKRIRVRVSKNLRHFHARR